MARGLIALLLAFADTARAFHARNALGRDGALRSATTDNEPIPPSALVTQAVDEATFEEERRRYSDFAVDGSLPRAFTISGCSDGSFFARGGGQPFRLA